MSLSGKNAVFVGGLGFIGYEACKSLMTRNLAYLFVLDTIENPNAVQALQAINAKTKVVYMKFDITNKTVIKNTIAEIVSKVKYIDALVNGAGILADPNVELTMNVNLIGLINTTLEALPYMNKSDKGRGGVLVNIASVLGLEPSPPVAVYSASKFGVMGFSRSIADPYYYGVTGVAVMTFCPGLTDTPLKNNLGSKVTFEYSKGIGTKVNSSKTQTPAQCGAHLAEVVEMSRNNEIYISDLGKLRKVEPTVYWQPTYE